MRRGAQRTPRPSLSVWGACTLRTWDGGRCTRVCGGEEGRGGGRGGACAVQRTEGGAVRRAPEREAAVLGPGPLLFVVCVWMSPSVRLRWGGGGHTRQRDGASPVQERPCPAVTPRSVP